MPIASHDPQYHMNPPGGPANGYMDPIGMPMPDDHHIAIGNFLIACAQLEETAHGYLRELLPIPDPVTRILVREPRFADLLDIISKTCAELGQGEPEQSQFREVKGLLAYTHSVRNIVVHNVPAWRDGWLRYDRYGKAKNISDRPHLIYAMQLSELDNLTGLARLTRLPFYQLTSYWLYQTQRKQKPAPVRLDELQTWLETRELPPNPDKKYQAPKPSE